MSNGRSPPDMTTASPLLKTVACPHNSLLLSSKLWFVLKTEACPHNCLLPASTIPNSRSANDQHFSGSGSAAHQVCCKQLSETECKLTNCVLFVLSNVSCPQIYPCLKHCLWKSSRNLIVIIIYMLSSMTSAILSIVYFCDMCNSWAPMWVCH